MTFDNNIKVTIGTSIHVHGDKLDNNYDACTCTIFSFTCNSLLLWAWYSPWHVSAFDTLSLNYEQYIHYVHVYGGC